MQAEGLGTSYDAETALPDGAGFAAASLFELSRIRHLDQPVCALMLRLAPGAPATVGRALLDLVDAWIPCCPGARGRWDVSEFVVLLIGVDAAAAAPLARRLRAAGGDRLQHVGVAHRVVGERIGALVGRASGDAEGLARAVEAHETVQDAVRVHHRDAVEVVLGDQCVDV